MKRLVYNGPKLATQVDWSKQQWLQNVLYPEMVILYNGVSNERVFTGTCLPCEQYHFGHYAEDWSKSQFMPLAIEIPFEISNQ